MIAYHVSETEKECVMWWCHSFVIGTEKPCVFMINSCPAARSRQRQPLTHRQKAELSNYRSQERQVVTELGSCWDKMQKGAIKKNQRDCHHHPCCLTSFQAVPRRSRASCWEKCICSVAPLHPFPATLWMSSPTEQSRLRVVMETRADSQLEQKQVVTLGLADLLCTEALPLLSTDSIRPSEALGK